MDLSRVLLDVEPLPPSHQNPAPEPSQGMQLLNGLYAQTDPNVLRRERDAARPYLRALFADVTDKASRAGESTVLSAFITTRFKRSETTSDFISRRLVSSQDVSRSNRPVRK